MKKGYRQQLPDRDPQETDEWIESIESVIDMKGQERARYLLQTLIREARDRNISIPLLTNSPYVNTIPPESEPDYPGDEVIERKIRRIIRWNAAMMVSKANKNFPGIYQVNHHCSHARSERTICGRCRYWLGHCSWWPQGRNWPL